jgi:predicted DNA-binding protein (MmcQ/YjbR family)
MAPRNPAAARAGRRLTTAGLVARLREICLALPEANEKLSHGEPTWFAGKGKVFAMLDEHHHGAAHLSVWLPQPLGRQADLIDADPDRFFRPPYVGPSGWLGVVLDRDPDWAMVATLVEDAYRHVARPRLVAQLDQPAPARAPTRRAAKVRRTGRSTRAGSAGRKISRS